MCTKVLDFDSLCDMLSADPFFSVVLDDVETNNHSYFCVQDGFLFKDNQLCIPDSSLRLKIIRELHDEGHVGKDKPFALIAGFYFWPSM